MNQQVKDTLIVALRSGKYQQQKMSLRTGNCYCIWGVICDLFDPNAWEKDFLPGSNERGGYYFTKYEPSGNRIFPPESVKQWAGIDYANSQLMELNDSGKTFDEIADYLEFGELKK